MAVTKYYIGNKTTGEEWDCQPRNFNGQLQNIDGIGFLKNSTYKRVDRFFINTFKENKQSVITGEMVFLTESKYNEFLDFISDATLYLKRVASDTKTVYTDIEINSFMRNDNDRFRNCFCLCDIDMTAISPWYKIKSVYENSVAGISKTYIYSYPYSYNQTGISVFELDIASKAGAIVNMRIYGESDPPEWLVTSEKGGLLLGKYNETIAEGEYLGINSVPSELGVWLHKKSSLKVNAWENCDRLLETFIIIPSGHTQIEVSSGDGANNVHCAIEVLEIEECP